MSDKEKELVGLINNLGDALSKAEKPKDPKKEKQKAVAKTGVGGLALSVLVSSNVLLHNDLQDLKLELKKELTPQVEPAPVKYNIANIEQELNNISYKIAAYHKGQVEQIKLMPDEIKKPMIKNGKSIARDDYNNIMTIVKKIYQLRLQDSNQALAVVYQAAQDEVGKIKGYIDNYNEL